MEGYQQSLSGYEVIDLKLKKIFLIYPKIFPVISGESVHGINLVKQLSSYGHAIVTYTQQPSPFYKVVERWNLYELFREILSSDVLYLRTPIDRYTKIERFINILFRGKFRIIEINGPLEERYSKGVMTVSSKKKRVFRKKLKMSNHIIVVSTILKEYLSNNHMVPRDKISIVSNGCNPSLFVEKNVGKTFMSDINKIKIFWAGNPKISFQGTESLEEITTHFAHHKNILFVIGGYSSIENLYQNTIVLPSIKYDLIHYYILDSDILLVLYGDYSWSPLGFYGSSLKFFDYMASGKPVIAPNLGHIKETGVHGKNLMLYSSVSDIINNIHLLIEDKKLRTAIGKEGRKSVKETYSWKSSIEKIHNIIQGYEN